MDNSSRIIALRKKLGLSQAEMAAEFGVSRSTLTHWENGTYPVPEMALNLLSLYEEFVDEDLALNRHDKVIRKLASTWTSRLAATFAKGARGDHRKRIKDNLENSLNVFLRHELSPYQIKRNLQIAAFNRLVEMAAKSKGLPMKLLQVMTFMNPAMAPIAREALERIHELQAPMAPTMVARVIHEDLGESPTKIFAEWSPRPFATASIGQVHRARLKTGEEVAVKIQYPEARAIVEKLKKAILDEADYVREREFQEAFRKIFAGHDRIVVPKTYAQYCSRRVLTMDYIDGKLLKEFKNNPEIERRLAAETITTFITQSAFRHSLMNTDTNAGNFIFCEGGKVAFIDFGRTWRVETEGMGDLLKAVIEKNEVAARPFLPKLFPLKAQKKFESYPYREIWYFFLKQQTHLHSGPFRFTREYIAQVINDGRDFPLRNDLQLSIEVIWSLATSVGLWNVLADLDVSVDYGKLSLNILNQKAGATLPVHPYS